MSFPGQARGLLTLTVGVLIAYACTARAATLYTIYTTGHSSNRIDILFLSEGYSSAQISKFLTDTTNSANSLLAQEPFSSYRGLFNVAAVFVASVQSGSDHPAYGVQKNTYFDSSYDAASDYLISIPVGAQGTGKILDLVQTYSPGAELPILLVNDPITGGSDGFGVAAIVSASAGTADILSHEVGHVLGGLGDEYEWPAPGFPDVEEPNTTRETRREHIKWRAWIESSTPVPTPETFEYADRIGLFEGAHYNPAGWYRPRYDCKMNHSSVPFCEVCKEALVLSFYSKTRPIDSFFPASTNVQVSPGGQQIFQVNTLQDVSAPFIYQWTTNGVPVPGATNSTFLLSGLVSKGIRAVGANVRDDTAYVRTDPTNLLAQAISWNITSPVVLDLPAFSSDGRFHFRLSGTGKVVVQGSTNLNHWNSIQTNVLVSGISWFTNDSSLTPVTFFRAESIP